jgi:CRP/FNR family transcriptional regulator, cyclic AMP receptor protein
MKLTWRDGDMTDDVVELLKTVPLFEGLSSKDLHRIAEFTKEVHHSDGEAVVEEDNSAVGFHLIVSGRVEASTGGHAVNTMGPGEYFGELSLIDGKPRSASVTAHGDLVTLSIPSWHFNQVLDEHPEMMRAMLVSMSAQIRRLTPG